MVFVVKQNGLTPVDDTDLKAEILVDDDAILQLIESAEIRKLLLNELGKSSVVVDRIGVKRNEDLFYKGVDISTPTKDVSKKFIAGKEFGFYGKL